MKKKLRARDLHKSIKIKNKKKRERNRLVQRRRGPLQKKKKRETSPEEVNGPTHWSTISGQPLSVSRQSTTAGHFSGHFFRALFPATYFKVFFTKRSRFFEFF